MGTRVVVLSVQQPESMVALGVVITRTPRTTAKTIFRSVHSATDDDFRRFITSRKSALDSTGEVERGLVYRNPSGYWMSIAVCIPRSSLVPCQGILHSPSCLFEYPNRDLPHCHPHPSSKTLFGLLVTCGIGSSTCRTDPDGGTRQTRNLATETRSLR